MDTVCEMQQVMETCQYFQICGCYRIVTWVSYCSFLWQPDSRAKHAFCEACGISYKFAKWFNSPNLELFPETGDWLYFINITILYPCSFLQKVSVSWFRIFDVLNFVADITWLVHLHYLLFDDMNSNVQLKAATPGDNEDVQLAMVFQIQEYEEKIAQVESALSRERSQKLSLEQQWQSLRNQVRFLVPWNAHHVTVKWEPTSPTVRNKMFDISVPEL